MLDRIEKSILINAPADRVWSLVSRPGWWLADNTEEVTAPAPHLVERFPVVTVELRPQTFCSFRWASEFPGEPLRADNSTLVEFTLTDTPDGVRVDVVESGFAGLAATEDAKAHGIRENSGGWETELAILRTRAERDG